MSFPDDFVNLLMERTEAADEAFHVVRRPLRDNDGDGYVGIFETTGLPGIFEIDSRRYPEPSTWTYNLSIQCQSKNATETMGRALGSFMAKKIRLMLYRDATLRTNLPLLTDTSMGVRESVTRWGSNGQEYAEVQLAGHFYYLCNTTVWIETQMIFEE